jgi:hypothetical protein
MTPERPDHLNLREGPNALESLSQPFLQGEEPDGLPHSIIPATSTIPSLATLSRQPRFPGSHDFQVNAAYTAAPAFPSIATSRNRSESNFQNNFINKSRWLDSYFP